MHGATHVRGGPDPVLLAWEDIEEPVPILATIGSTAAAANSFTGNAQQYYLHQYQLTGAVAGSVWESVSARISGGTSVLELRIVIYTNNISAPDALVDWVELSVPTGSTEAVHTASLSGTAVANNLGYYWLGLQIKSNNGPKTFYDSTTGVMYYDGAGFAYGTAPKDPAPGMIANMTRSLRVSATAAGYA